MVSTPKDGKYANNYLLYWKLYLHWWMVNGVFVIRERPTVFPVKGEMACFYLGNCDFIRIRELWFSKRILREISILSVGNCDFIRSRELWFSKIILREISILSVVNLDSGCVSYHLP